MKSKNFQLFKIFFTLFLVLNSTLITIYFVFRFIFWDKLPLVGFIGNFLLWLLFPTLSFPIILYICKNKMFFYISTIFAIVVLCWFHSKYFSPTNFNVNNDTLNISILSANLGQNWVDINKFNKFILQQDADITFLQEVTKKHIENASVGLQENYPYQIYGPLQNKVGMGILSKYPISSHRDFKLAEEGLVFQQRATINYEKREIVVYNIHTTYPWFQPKKFLSFLTIPVYDYSTRSKEIQNLLKLLQDEKLPVIAAGDFNMTDRAQDYARLTDRLIDSWKESGWGFGFTWPARKHPNNGIKLDNPIIRIDYIMHSEDWISKETQVLSRTGSDHLPLTTKLFFVTK